MAALKDGLFTLLASCYNHDAFPLRRSSLESCMKRYWVLALVAAFTALSACVPQGHTPPPAEAPGQPAAYPEINLVKKVAITTDTEGGSARPEIVATTDRVFVVYLGNISNGGDRFFGLKIFDRELSYTIASKTLVPTTSQYGGPTDIRVASDGQYLYAFYETHKPISPKNASTYLWGVKYTLDDNFERVAYTAVPIVSSKPMAELEDGGELLDDPAPLVGPDSIFVITRLKYPLTIAGKTIYRVREFDKGLRQVRRQFDLDLSSVADGRGRVNSLLFHDSTIYIALATTVSSQGVMESNDDGALSDIILVRLRADWTLDPQRGAQPLSAEPSDRENYVSGFDSDGNAFYIAYKQSVGSPPAGEQRAWIKVYDKDFNIIQTEMVKTTIWGPSGGGIRPSLEVSGNRVFSGQSSREGIGQGNAEVYVYEIVE